jgi:hypothetical protein
MTPKFPINFKVLSTDGSTDAGTVVEIDIDNAGQCYLVRRTYAPYEVLTHWYGEDELTDE